MINEVTTRGTSQSAATLLDRMLSRLRDWKLGDPLDPGGAIDGLTTEDSVAKGDIKRALRTARAVNAGRISVNCYGEGDSATPFGGVKQSGFGGRDNGAHTHDQYTELKTIWIDLSDSAPDEQVI